jgi:hypothetical protein
MLNHVRVMLNHVRRYRQSGLCGVRANKALMPAGVAVVIVVIGALTVSGVAAGPPALPDFTVNLNPVSNRIMQRTLLVADKVTGNYSEVFSAVFLAAGSGTFSATGYWDAGQFVHSDGTVPYLAKDSNLGLDYSIYALFSYAGTFTFDGSDGFDGSNGFEFVANSGSITLYVDRNTRTTKTLPNTATLPIALSENDDDSILASATLLAGNGHFRIPNALSSGNFGLAFNPVVLTSLGSRFFVNPSPFYTGMLFKGQFNSFDNSTNQQITGSADVWMQ